ncbi:MULTISPECIES: DUF5990 family protein [Nonomuraea]|uniref:DUF5990 family protein n=1 Tax=Nonomuraea ferruginea TaxID=46174 RepID=A0ABT4SSI8_9ACTN|nr:DUF5990 family protein [Nonomuraea ferruginea]MDA0640227.1 DUF5990 family protein [Nonomuraea ferruginea]
MLLRIEASDLPGLECGLPGVRDIHVGVQRRARPGELTGTFPADAPSAVWELEVAATRGESGWDLRGPFVQGGPGGRFVYLSWMSADDAGRFSMFRRAKLLFDGVPPDVLDAAVGHGLLVARLGLTDARGHPLCAAVRPPLVEWSAPAPR